MWLGLDHHTPNQALKILCGDAHAMSVAIHEITHFVSLRNVVGRTLTLYGQMASMQAEEIRHRLASGQRVGDSGADWFLYLRSKYVAMLRSWAPLFEGMALYAQTSGPCRQADSLPHALEALLAVAATFEALDVAPPDRAAPTKDEWLEKVGGGVLGAGYTAMELGPVISVEDRPLSVYLELPRTSQAIPYFLGHAYVRAIEDRLVTRTRRTLCPEDFQAILLGVLRRSGHTLLSGGHATDSPAYLHRIYNWVDLVEQAPLQRLDALSDLDDDVDVLTYLQTGQRRPLFDRDQAPERSIGDLAVRYADEFERIDGHAWHVFTRAASSISEYARAQHGDDVAAEDVLLRITAGTVLGVESLNISMGGEANLAGFGRAALDGRHVVAVRTDTECWWISLAPAELDAFPWATSGLPDFQSQNQDFATWCSERNGPMVLLDVYLSYVSWGPVQAEGVMPRVLVQIRDETRSALFIAQPGPPNSNRAVLVQLPSERFEVLGSNMLRESVSRAFAATPAQLAKYLSQRGESLAAERVLEAGRRDELASARQEAIWARKILTSLLGGEATAAVRRQLMSDGLKGFLPADDVTNLLVSNSFGQWTTAELLEAAHWKRIEEANARAIEHIGKPLFEASAYRRSVRYLGLWGTASRGGPE